MPIIIVLQPTGRRIGKRLVSSRLMFGMTRGAVALPRFLGPPTNPIKLEVVFDAVFGRKTSEQVPETLVVREIVKIETSGILVKDVELFREAHGQQLLGLEFLVADDVPRLRNGFPM